MGTLDESVAKRIGRLIGRLGSDHDGEVLNAVALLKKLFCTERLSFSDIAAVIEDRAGTEVRKQYYDAAGRPRWHEIALFCQRNSDRLESVKERMFVDQMAGWTVAREPSEKQASWLESIFARLGGGSRPSA
jgi:hypothetical protein